MELQLEFQPLLPASPSTYGLGSRCRGIQPFDTGMIVLFKCVGLHLWLSSIICSLCASGLA